ncbi:MAG TPA: efflux RND transporter periplasmic adaptor subunit [Pyrinomonadaceae bacterium]|jgi:multidrug efflux pump subunit AcrA (membrane-fusion protein)
MSEPEEPVNASVADEHIVTHDSEIIRHEETMSPVQRIHPGLIAALILAIVVVFLFGWYLLRSGNSRAGQPVPAPRFSNDAPAQTLVNQTVTLSPEQAKNAGITIETVGEQLSTESAETSATGTIEANGYRQTPASTIAGGIVRRVVPQLGDHVTAGQTVAVVSSDEFAQTQSRYISLATEAENARRNYDRAQKLATINQPGRTEVDAAAKQRVAAEASLSEMRNRYERTVRLVQIGAASREELEQDNTKLKTAQAELDEARLRESRATELLPISAEVKSSEEDALNKLRTAEGDLAATRQRLILFGMAPSRVNALRNPSQVTSELTVPAPISGTVTARNVNPGEAVEANKELVQVTDLSTVWVVAQVYEQDLGRLRVGSGASVTSDAFPNRLFRGQIAYIDPQLDQATRTAKVRVEIPNPNRELKLGMYVRVALGASGGAEPTMPVVQSAAVQNINGQQIVFVPTPDANVFELRPVRLGSESDGRFQVLEGLTVGDKVVTNGSFALRAEWLKANQSAGQ